MSENLARRLVFFILGIAASCLGLGIAISDVMGASDKQAASPVRIALGGLFFIMGLAMIWPERAQFLTQIVAALLSAWKGTKRAEAEAEATPPSVEPMREIVETYSDVIGAKEPPPPPDQWYTSLRPVLHQVAQYSAPTYYLDRNYFIVDWNVAFGLIFAKIAGALRGKHVNWLIALLQNREEVYDHARDFTQQEIPLVDVEPLVYASRDYGEVRFLKVAFQLHDAAGQYRGWAVTLMIQQINWDRFQADLLVRVQEAKIWSVYAASYDAVLLNYPDYHNLIAKVIDAVPGSGKSVADLGAGTGNCTAALLKRGHSVTAVENSYEMIDRFRSRKDFDPARVRMVKCSVECLGLLDASTFDAAVMVNVLYAVEDPLACLQGINRILKKDGVLALSTTHRGTELKPLLEDIERKLKDAGLYEKLADDYARVLEVNRRLEAIARRHTKDEYLEWVSKAGFEISSMFPSEYQGAVMVIHARKIRHLEDGGP